MSAASNNLQQDPPSSMLQTDSTELSCSKKIVVTLTLANNKLYASDELQFTLSCVNRYAMEAWPEGMARPCR